MFRTACARSNRSPIASPCLRDGRKITTVAPGDVSETELVELMTGRKIGVLFPQIDHRPAKICSRSNISPSPIAR